MASSSGFAAGPDGVRVYYEVYGDPTSTIPPVARILLLPGIGGIGADFAPQLPGATATVDGEPWLWSPPLAERRIHAAADLPTLYRQAFAELLAAPPTAAARQQRPPVGPSPPMMPPPPPPAPPLPRRPPPPLEQVRIPAPAVYAPQLQQQQQLPPPPQQQPRPVAQQAYTYAPAAVAAPPNSYTGSYRFGPTPEPVGAEPVGLARAASYYRFAGPPADEGEQFFQRGPTLPSLRRVRGALAEQSMASKVRNPLVVFSHPQLLFPTAPFSFVPRPLPLGGAGAPPVRLPPPRPPPPRSLRARR